MQSVDGKLLALVTRKTEPLRLILSSNHHEHIELFVITTPLNILGIPWLNLHNLYIHWSTATKYSWSNHCNAHCLKSALPARSTVLSPTSEENVPPDYHDLQQVFNKASASYDGCHQCSSVLTWVHTSRIAYHPGVHCTVASSSSASGGHP